MGFEQESAQSHEKSVDYSNKLSRFCNCDRLSLEGIEKLCLNSEPAVKYSGENIIVQSLKKMRKNKRLLRKYHQIRRETLKQVTFSQLYILCSSRDSIYGNVNSWNINKFCLWLSQTRSSYFAAQLEININLLFYSSINHFIISSALSANAALEAASSTIYLNHPKGKIVVVGFPPPSPPPAPPVRPPSVSLTGDHPQQQTSL